MAEIRKLRKQLSFNNNLIYCFKGKGIPKSFIGFKGPLGLFSNINVGYINIKKSEENQKNLNQI